MAMSEASKLFDSSGGAGAGSKQDAINGAAMTAMKLMTQGGGGGIGGALSGGLPLKMRLLQAVSSYPHSYSSIPLI